MGLVQIRVVTYSIEAKNSIKDVGLSACAFANCISSSFSLRAGGLCQLVGFACVR